jgi:hypothetical protein
MAIVTSLGCLQMPEVPAVAWRIATRASNLIIAQDLSAL